MIFNKHVNADCVAIQPHPLPIPLTETKSKVNTKRLWLRQAGYTGGLKGFMKYYRFKNSATGRGAAVNLLKGFRDHPTREHPGWMSLFVDKGPPDIKRDDEWLVLAGYEDIGDFMTFYDFEPEHEVSARKLLKRFRARHQFIWKDQMLVLIEEGEEVLEAFKPSKPLDPYFAEVDVKMTTAQIEEVIALHEGQGHMGYYKLKELSRSKVLHYVPEFVENMRVDDIPGCKNCTKMGAKDR